MEQEGGSRDLDGMLARWGARMEAFSDRPHPTWTPRPLVPAEMRQLVADVERTTEGEGRESYFRKVTGWNGLAHEGPIWTIEGSRKQIKPTLRIFQALKVEQWDTAFSQLTTEEQTNLFHWFFCADHFQWMTTEWSEVDRKTLAALRRFMLQYFYRDHIQELQPFQDRIKVQRDFVLQSAVHESLFCPPELGAKKMWEHRKVIGSPAVRSGQRVGVHGGNIQELIARGPILDCGCGMSGLSLALRQLGGDVATLDPMSMAELHAQAKKLYNEDGDREVEEFLTTDHEVAAAHHQVGFAAGIPRVFGEGRFATILASDSLTQPDLIPLIRRNPDRLWKEMVGALWGLRPDRGELRMSMMPIYYTPSMMNRVWMPIMIALQAAGFEIAGSHEPDHAFSFTRFLERHLPSRPSAQNFIAIRRHPDSHIHAANRMMQKFFAAMEEPQSPCL